MDKAKRSEKAFDFAADLIKQLITLSTGIVTITLTFAKDIFTKSSNQHTGLLLAGWTTHLVSIVFGVAALMGFTGTLERTADGIYGSSGRWFLGLQVIAFLIATALLVIAGICSGT